MSGHHHAYYPAHKGDLQLLHMGILGAGPRPLIDSDLPPWKALTVLDVDFDTPELTRYTTYDMQSMDLIEYAELPRFLTGHNGLLLRRDVEFTSLSADEKSVCEAKLGAADGAGLGIQFLKHLARTRLLLHLVDVQPYESDEDPVNAAQKIVAELEKWGEGLGEKPRWLVLNKIDRLTEETVDQHCRAIVDGLHWQGQVFRISALQGDGLRELIFSIMSFLEQKQGNDEEQD